MRIAIVHEYLNQFGGAERVLQILCSLFPDAPIYTLFYDKYATGGVFSDREVRTSFLQKMPLINQYHQLFPLLMPLAIEQFDFSKFDIVLSLSASFAKGVITKPGTRHVCYCLTPPRFLWDDSQKFVEDFGYPKLIKKTIPPLITYLRLWDREASLRVDKFITTSQFVKQRILKYYKCDAEVIYCPVNVSKFHISDEAEDYFFMVGRLVSYKKFDLAIRVFNKLKLPLRIAGTGPEMKNLKKIAGPTIKFLGLISDQQLAAEYSKARALIFPQEEDFGLTPLESMSSGRPVIAYRGGGAMETIKEGVTGVFFDEQTEDSLEAVLTSFDHLNYNPRLCRDRAEEFSINEFKNKILGTLEEI